MIGYILLLLFAFLGLFVYYRRSTFFQLMPLGLLVGAVFLFLRQTQGGVVDFTDNWSTVPGLLINVVFATLFFGKKIMRLGKIWAFAGPQIVFGQMLAWGQYVVGIALTAMVLIPLFSVSPLYGALIEIGFEGGHGTAAGLGPLFTELGFSEGADLALGLATVGIVAGLASGLVATAIYEHLATHKTTKKKQVKKQQPIHTMFGEFVAETHATYFSSHVIARTILQLGFVGLAIVLGIALKELLILIESFIQLFASTPEVMTFIPLFPLAMIGGIVVQLILQKTGKADIVHGKTMAFIGSIALEIVIITAIATMSLSVISDNLAPFLLLAIAGFVWNLFAFLILAPRIIKDRWFERGIGDYGQSMGMTATGLLLMRSADPANKTQALERFGYKQLLFEPVVGGGIFTAMSMVLIAEYGQLAIFILVSTFLVFWGIIARFALR